MVQHGLAKVIGIAVYPLLAEGAWGRDTNFFFYKELRLGNNTDMALR